MGRPDRTCLAASAAVPCSVRGLLKRLRVHEQVRVVPAQPPTTRHPSHLTLQAGAPTALRDGTLTHLTLQAGATSALASHLTLQAGAPTALRDGTLTHLTLQAGPPTALQDLG